MSESAPVVWVVQEGRNDYSAAEEFGDVRFVTKGDLTKFDNSTQNDEVMSDIRRFKSMYIPGKDYIIPAGNPMLVASLTMSLPKVNQGHKMLKWDGRKLTYVPFNVRPV